MRASQAVHPDGSCPTDASIALREAIHSSVERWQMLAGVKRLGVGLSGGADSIALLDGLMAVVDPDIEIVPLHVHQHPRHQDADLLVAYIEDRYDLRTRVIEADSSVPAGRVIALGKSPCRACAPIRARRLGEAAREMRLDALALGHHLDDAGATLLMNIFHRGSVDTMRPVARRRTQPGIPLVRPMLLVPESAVKDASPVEPCGLFDCGMCSMHAQERARASRFVAETFAAHAPAPAFVADLVASLAERGESRRRRDSHERRRNGGSR